MGEHVSSSGTRDVCELCGEFSHRVSERNGVVNRGGWCVGRGKASSFIQQQLKAGIIQFNTPVIRGD